MTSSDQSITSAQVWVVRLKPAGEKAFRTLGGSERLGKWSFRVSIPEQEGRTAKELVEQVRSAGIESIFRECQKDGLSISRDDLRRLDSHEYIEGTKQ